MKDSNGIDLKYPEALLPDSIENCIYRCEVHSYDESKLVSIHDFAARAGLTRVHASRVNAAKGELFPVRQTFYISENDSIRDTLEAVVEDSKLTGIWVENMSQVNWSEFYNVEVDDIHGTSKLLEYHQTVEYVNSKEEAALNPEG